MAGGVVGLNGVLGGEGETPLLFYSFPMDSVKLAGKGGGVKKGKVAKNYKTNNINLIQINTQHAKVATDDAILFAKKYSSPILLIQEPYVNNKNCIPKPAADVLTSAKYEPGIRTRACIHYHKSTASNMWFMDSLSTPDCATIQTKVNNNPALLVSCYMDGNDKSCPPQCFKTAVEYAKTHQLALVTSIDANAHNSVWHSTINDNHRKNRGDQLLDYLIDNNLTIENVGKTPTFDNGRWKNIIDLTITNKKGHDLVNKWQVDTTEVNSSDHNFISFSMKTKDPVNKTKFRDVAKTNWPQYNEDLSKLMKESKNQLTNLSSPQLINKAAGKLAEDITTAFNNATEEIFVSNKIKSPPWETKEVRQARADIRHRLRKARNTKHDKDWNELRSHQAEYRRLVNHSKSTKFKEFCAKLEAQSSGKRISNLIKEDKTTNLGTIRNSNGKLTESPEETLKVLEETHFKSHQGTPPGRNSSNTSPANPSRESHDIEEIFSKKRLQKALKEFNPMSAAGPDGIRPIMLQRGWDEIHEHFAAIAKASYLISHTPECWRRSTGIFIPKPGKSDYYNPKAYRTITLAPSMLKWMERVILWHMEVDLKIYNKLSKKQYGFTKGVSTETALHKLVNKLETAILHKGMALCTFLDIEGAFDNVSFDAIQSALNMKCNNPKVNSWIMDMIRGRSMTVELNGIKKIINISRGCPQGGILSPFLWNLVVDSLLTYTKDKIPCDLQGFADDLCLTKTLNSPPKGNNMGLNEDDLRNPTQQSLEAINEWCKLNGLKLSSLKTHAVMFTWTRKWKLTKPLSVDGEEIEMKESTKLLGITIDSKLNWNQHIKNITNKAKSTLMLCKRIVGATWGVTPKTMKWIFTAIIRPRLTYAAAIWIGGTKSIHNQKLLESAQRLATKLVTGCMPSTPKTALDKITNLTPITLWLEEEAIKGALRLQSGGHWETVPAIPSRGNLQSHIKTINDLTEDIPILRKTKDTMVTKLSLDTKFTIEIPDKETYQELPSNENTIQCYTDGSMINESVGSGIFIKSSTELIHEESIHLGTSSTVFQAEMYGVQKTADVLLEKKIIDKNIIFNCDSQAAIKALDSLKIKSKTTQTTLETLNTLATNNTVLLRWIPAHSGYVGNEKADDLAKDGANNMNSTCTTLPIPGCVINSTLKNRTARKWEIRRSKEQSSFFSTMWREKFTKDIEKLSKNNLRIATHILTGHAALNYHLNKYKPMNIKKACPHCSDADETITHYLGKCSKWSYQRFLIFGMFYMDPPKIADKSSLTDIV